MPGLTATGFEVLTFADIVSELEDAFRAALGDTIDVNPETSVLGRLIGVLADRESDLWDLALSLYAAQNPNTASGAGLDAICAITGTTREPARKSSVVLTVVGTPPATVPSGFAVKTAGANGARFLSDSSADLIALSDWSALTVYSAGQRVKNGLNAYQCTVGGTSASSGGPTGTGTAIVDASVTWRFIGAGSGAVEVEAFCDVTGPISAVAFTVNEIETPAAGIAAAINFLDAETGADIESDAALRLRRLDELSQGGAATSASVRAEILAVEGVTSCGLIVNNTDSTVDSVPPHAIEAVVEGGADQDIFDALLASVAAGIATSGSTSGFAEDAEGVDQPVAFTRPTAKPVFIVINITKSADEYGTSGDAAVKAALVAFGDTRQRGQDVVSSALAARAFSVPGVLDVTACFIGFSASPVSESTLTVNTRERATFDTSRITVNAINGSL